MVPFQDNSLELSFLLGESRARDDRQVGNLDFDARVPIPISVFPSTYRSDATSVETTTETRVEGEVNQGSATQRVGREDTRFREKETTVYGRTQEERPGRQTEEFRVVEEQRVSDRYPARYEERQYSDRQFDNRQERFAEVDLSRER